ENSAKGAGQSGESRSSRSGSERSLGPGPELLRGLDRPAGWEESSRKTRRERGWIMIRLFHAYFPSRTLLLGVSEAVVVVLAFVLATVLWFGVTDADLILVYERGFLKILLVSGIFILCMYYFDLYDTFVLASRREVLTRFAQVLGTVSVIQAVLYYTYPPLRLGRGVFLVGDRNSTRLNSS